MREDRFWSYKLKIVIAGGLEYLTKEQVTKLTNDTDALGRGLNGLIQTVRGCRAA